MVGGVPIGDDWEEVLVRNVGVPIGDGWEDVAPLKIITYRAIKTTGTLIGNTYD